MDERKPVRGFSEEGGRSHLEPGDPKPSPASVEADDAAQAPSHAEIPSPAPMSDADAALEASIRMKLDRGEPLDPEERAFFARMPADHERYYTHR